MTREHIIPKWLIMCLNNFGVTHGEICKQSGIGKGELYRNLCPACNLYKNGVIDYTDPLVRKYMSAFVSMMCQKIIVHRDSKKKLIVKSESVETRFQTDKAEYEDVRTWFNGRMEVIRQRKIKK